MLSALLSLACTPGPDFVSTLHPERPDTEDDLVAVALGTQGETEGFRYRWFLAGIEVLDLEGDVVPHERTRRGEVWTLRVEHEQLEGLDEHQVEVVNALPELAGVQVLPEGANEAEELSCSVIEEPWDADGDELELQLQWLVDGQPSGIEGPEVSASETLAGQEWSCIAQVFDGLELSEPVSASVLLTERGADWPEHVRDLSEAEIQLLGETNEGRGFNAGEWAGWRLAGLGDVDGDGLADALTVGRFNDTLADDAGKIYLVRASELPALEGAEASLAELSTSWLGEGENDHLGRDVVGPGDLDGDGLGELLVSTFAAYEDQEEAGTVQLFLSGDIELGSTGLASDAHFVVRGRAHREWVGRSLDGLGDLDGDGLPELFVGIPGHNDGLGRAAVFAGSQAMAGGEVSSEEAAWILEGDWPQGGGGIAVTRAGDMDGDGVEDLGIGGWLSSEGARDAGKTWVVLGASLQTGISPLAEAEHSWISSAQDQSTGRVVAEAGDVDGDGLDDLLTGGHGAPETGAAMDGAVWLILGGALQDSGALEDVGHRFEAEGEGDYAGDAVASADVDGDGKPDLLFGAHMNARGGEECGAVYLFLNDSVQEPGVYSLGEADRIWVGESSFDRAGVSVQSAGDMNGDGSDDILVGATTYDADRGKTYILMSPFFD